MKAKSPAPLALPRLSDHALSGQSHVLLLWVMRAPSLFTPTSPSSRFRRLPPPSPSSSLGAGGFCHGTTPGGSHLMFGSGGGAPPPPSQIAPGAQSDYQRRLSAQVACQRHPVPMGPGLRDKIPIVFVSTLLSSTKVEVSGSCPGLLGKPKATIFVGLV